MTQRKFLTSEQIQLQTGGPPPRGLQALEARIPRRRLYVTALMAKTRQDSDVSTRLSDALSTLKSNAPLGSKSQPENTGHSSPTQPDIGNHRVFCLHNGSACEVGVCGWCV